MRARLRMTIGLGLAALSLTACLSPDEESGLVPTQALVAATSPSGGGLVGGLGEEGGAPTPGGAPMPAPSLRPVTPSPTPKPTAAPGVSIQEVRVSRTHLLLFLPPSDSGEALALPTRHQLSGSAVRADGFSAPVAWEDRSGGQLSLSTSGLLATTPATLVGVHRVRCASRDDPNVFQDVTVEVRATSALSVIIQ